MEHAEVTGKLSLISEGSSYEGEDVLDVTILRNPIIPLFTKYAHGHYRGAVKSYTLAGNYQKIKSAIILISSLTSVTYLYIL